MRDLGRVFWGCVHPFRDRLEPAPEETRLHQPIRSAALPLLLATHLVACSGGEPQPAGSLPTAPTGTGSPGAEPGGTGSPDAGPTGQGSTPGTGPTVPTPGAGQTAGAPGYLHTQGSEIVDANGNPVRLTGLSWFGMETANFAPHGLWTRAMGAMLDEVKSLGFNTLRIPFSNQLFDASSAPNSIDYSKNPDLVGLDGLQILDKLIAGAKVRGLRVILDRHRPDASGQSELWYTAQVSEQRWIADWEMLAARYKGDPTVIGCDLHNEPHGAATWGDGNLATDWRLAAQRAGEAILAINPDLLIFVEGVEHADGASYWWGGNLRSARRAPVVLSVPDRLVYSPHDYPATVYPQTWFGDPAYPANLPSVWEANWAYLAASGLAPVWIGEFGTRDQTTSDQQWFRTLAGYIGLHQLSFAFWCLNPDSGDTGGLLEDDWTTVNGDKQAVLQPLLAPLL
jgi:endoglucanase